MSVGREVLYRDYLAFGVELGDLAGQLTMAGHFAGVPLPKAAVLALRSDPQQNRRTNSHADQIVQQGLSSELYLENGRRGRSVQKSMSRI